MSFSNSVLTCYFGTMTQGAFEFSFDAPTDELRMKQVGSLELLFGQKFE